MAKMTKGFIDSASLHGALGALILGKSSSWDQWMQQNILESTYLLLHSNIGIIPGPGDYAGATGEFEQLVKELPSLEAQQFDIVAQTDQKTRGWLSRWPDLVEKAWNSAQTDPSFNDWASFNIEVFWMNHVQMHGSLFNEQYIPTIARLTGAKEEELVRLHSMTKVPKIVRGWQKRGLRDEASRLANRAYLISALIRGKFHEFIAQDEGLQLISHPFRKFVQAKLPKAREVLVSNSEQYFVKMIVGAAIRETSRRRRVGKWLSTIENARKAIDAKRIYLPNASTISDGEKRAAQAVKEIGLCTTPKLARSAFELVLKLAGGALVSIALTPWVGPIVPVALWAYEFNRGHGIGDKLARSAFDTKRRFAKLAKTIPGRIERHWDFDTDD